VIDAGESRRFAEARAAVLAAIAAACSRADRNPSAVRLVAVTKTVPADRVRAALDAGHTLFGENRVQELAAKASAVQGATWHLIGPLQSNKARRAIEAADMIESVDSIALAVRLDRITREVRALPATGDVDDARRLTVLLQVNVDDDPAKAGFPPDDLAAAVPRIAALGALRLAGLMTIGRQSPTAEDARPTFRALRELSARLRERDERLGPELSMGMTDDYPIAVEEGATIVRVGRALFGERPDHHHEGGGGHHAGGDSRSHEHHG
jgi:pyridoxal phosphate enzyme (YggS family)